MKSSKIIICPKCQGLGKLEESELEDYHHRHYKYYDVVCDRCRGLGRVMEITEVTERMLTEEELKINPPEGDKSDQVSI